MKIEKLVALFVVSVVISGCAVPSMVTQMNESVAEQQAQARTVLKLYQDPSNVTDSGTLSVSATISEVSLVEVTKESSLASGLLDPFGSLGKISGTAIDSGNEGETISTKKFELTTESGVVFVTTQPEDEEYDQDLSEGDSVSYLSLKPVDEGNNIFYMKKI